MTKSGPPNHRWICRYCGLDTAVSTNHSETRECIDALQREVYRLRDHLRHRPPTNTAVSRPPSDRANTSAMSPAPIDVALDRNQSSLKRVSRLPRSPAAISLATALMLLFASIGQPQTPTPNGGGEPPTFRVQIWGDSVADFSTRISRYAELRSKLEKGQPALTVTDDPAEIDRAVIALGRKIRRARERAIQGEIFTPAITAAFRKTLLVEMNRNAWAAIMDDNPGEFSHQINGIYPKRKPLSTVPPYILAALPRLPNDIQYRFVGRHLILHDSRANLILDRIPCAIQCLD